MRMIYAVLVVARNTDALGTMQLWRGNDGGGSNCRGRNLWNVYSSQWWNGEDSVTTAALHDCLQPISSVQLLKVTKVFEWKVTSVNYPNTATRPVESSHPSLSLPVRQVQHEDDCPSLPLPRPAARLAAPGGGRSPGVWPNSQHCESSLPPMLHRSRWAVPV